MASGAFTAIVLGSGQDAGVPQLGGPPVPVPRRTAASLAVTGADGTVILVDASPDLRHQYDLIAPDSVERTAGTNPFDAVLLTHAHMGHYTGLVHLGREAANSRRIPCHASRSMLDFLNSNEPWSSLFRNGNLDPMPVEPGLPFALGSSGLSAIGHAIPHRPDLSDTLAYEMRVAGGRSLLYLPDIDLWSDWPGAAETLSRVDTALVDGTFHGLEEHPSRDLSRVPHPTVRDTVTRFGALAQDTRLLLTHLNWSNPLCDPASPERAAVEAAGFEVAEDGLRIEL